MYHELFDKILRWGGGEFLVEVDDEKVLHAQIADQRDFVLGGSKQVRRVARPQHLEWVWIERYNDRRAVGRPRMTRLGGDHGLMTKRHAVENADREKDGAVQA